MKSTDILEKCGSSGSLEKVFDGIHKFVFTWITEAHQTGNLLDFEKTMQGLHHTTYVNALELAAYLGNTEMCKALLKKCHSSANINTALELAVAQNHLGPTKLLYKRYKPMVTSLPLIVFTVRFNRGVEENAADPVFDFVLHNTIQKGENFTSAVSDILYFNQMGRMEKIVSSTTESTYLNEFPWWYMAERPCGKHYAVLLERFPQVVQDSNFIRYVAHASAHNEETFNVLYEHLSVDQKNVLYDELIKSDSTEKCKRLFTRLQVERERDVLLKTIENENIFEGSSKKRKM